MTPQGSFYPLRRDARGDHPVMFAYIIDAEEQREALDEEIMTRLGAIQELSETIATAQLEWPGSRSHGGILEAVAILSRDVRGLLEARSEQEP
ncbi:hypothetical protein [Tahibacter sp.]|uniref:hypothetical protein n=1 Tax=Tahibacter sp. TaxID=2056211 RepID=UPI0028C3DF9D|nr:hypothetical protein [Tahibacter sp.]